MKLNNLKYAAYSYGGATLEQLERIYNNYGIACVCDADDQGYFILAETLQNEN